MAAIFKRSLFGVLLLAGAGAACSPAEDTTPASPPPASSVPVTPAHSSAYPESQIAPDLPVLHADINNGAKPAETVRLAYEFAARHPEVLKYIPCFCGCERMGHKGNDDCFVGARDKNGKVTEWQTHGLICDVCIDVAQQAMQMHNAGASTAEIRRAIDQRYAARPSQMGTPMPPAKGAKGQ